MAKLTTDHLLFWFGTTPFPSGFVRHEIGTTARFLSGAAASVDPGATGGALTHTHTTVAHDHADSSHTHSFTGSEVTHGLSGTTPATGTVGPPGAGVTHTHDAKNFPASLLSYATSTYNLNASSSGATTPPYIEVLLIRPDPTGGLEVPSLACCFFNSATPPTGFSKCDGTGSPPTPNADTRFLLAATNATSSGGATGGVTTAHGHTTAASHNHSVSVNADHATDVCGSSSIKAGWKDGGGTGRACVDQHHDCQVTPHVGETTLSATPTNADSATNIEPAHVKLACVQNTSGADAMPSGIITAYKGTLAALASLSDWKLCDGTSGTPDLRAKQVKSQFTSVGTTGGSNDHTHDASGTHTHTHGGSHNHTISDIVVSSPEILTTAGPILREAVGSQHDNAHTWTVAATTPVSGVPLVGGYALGPALDPYLEVLWVQYAPGGLTASLSDTETLTDTGIRTPGKAAADSETLTDASIRQPGKTNADTATLADAASTRPGKVNSDTETLSDAATIAVLLGKVDTVSLADDRMMVSGASRSDVITLTDERTSRVVLLFNESSGRFAAISLADARKAKPGKNLADTVTLEDAVDRTTVTLRTIDETVTLTDAAVQTVGKGLADSVTLADVSIRSPGRASSDTVILSDAVALAIAAAQSDSITLSESSFRLVTLARSDAVVLSDLAVPELNPGVIPVNWTMALADMVAAGDLVNNNPTRAPRSMIEHFSPPWVGAERALQGGGYGAGTNSR